MNPLNDGMIGRCLIIDTETTALSPDQGERIEIAAVVYSLRAACALVHFAALMPAGANPLSRINRIPETAVQEISRDALTVHGGSDYVSMIQNVVNYAVASVDVVVAHHVRFDQQWWSGDIRKLPWLCTMEDFKFPRATKENPSLLQLAIDHDVPIGLVHRALPDCMLIASVLSTYAPNELQALFRHAMRPKGLFIAVNDNGSHPFEFMRKDEAKDHGFKWEAEGAPEKSWSKRMAIDDVASLPFRVKRLD